MALADSFYFSYLSASLYQFCSYFRALSSPTLFFFGWKKADGRSWQGFSLWVPWGGDVCRCSLDSHEQPVFPASIFRNISNILWGLGRIIYFPYHLIWEMQIRWKYFLNQISIFYLFAWQVSFQNRCHVFLFLSLNVGAGRSLHCLF